MTTEGSKPVRTSFRLGNVGSAVAQAHTLMSLSVMTQVLGVDVGTSLRQSL